MANNITPYNQPTDLFAQMRKEMNDLFANWFGPRAGSSLLANWPTSQQLFTPVDVHEQDGEFVVRLDVPGVTDKDLKITCQGDLLTVRGERKEEKTEGKGERRYSERAYGSFMRTITLPAPIKSEEVRARYKDGVLEVHLPKAQKTTSREVKIEAGG